MLSWPGACPLLVHPFRLFRSIHRPLSPKCTPHTNAQLISFFFAFSPPGLTKTAIWRLSEPWRRTCSRARPGTREFSAYPLPPVAHLGLVQLDVLPVIPVFNAAAAAGVPFVDRTVRVETLAAAIVAGLEDGSVSGPQRIVRRPLFRPLVPLAAAAAVAVVVVAVVGVVMMLRVVMSRPAQIRHDRPFKRLASNNDRNLTMSRCVARFDGPIRIISPRVLASLLDFTGRNGISCRGPRK